MLDAGAQPTAVFCSSDLLAHGALEEARSRGLSVPRDLALMGFGDLEFAQHTYPPLSTVRIDRAAIGRPRRGADPRRASKATRAGGEGRRRRIHDHRPRTTMIQKSR